MHFSSMVIRATIAVFVALGLPVAAWTRQRGPRVEVICPMPPAPVRIDAQQVLVYELHVTNFDLVPLILTRLEVFGSEQGGTPLIALSEKSLAAAMIRVGLKSDSEMPKDAENTEMRTIAAGMRAVVYVWIELPLNQILPTTLRHRMVFSADSEELSSDETLEDYAVPVSPDPVPTLSSPVNGGVWVTGDGPANNANHRRGITAIDGHIYSAERFAVDWIKVGPNGDSHDGTDRNENWWGFSEPVLAVADGEITEVVDGIADNAPRNLPPVTRDNIAGNLVTLQISPNRYVTYAHLQKGSVKVQLPDKVRRGTVLALLGNSGNATAAHLHLQVTDQNSVLQSQGMPFVKVIVNERGE